MKYMNTQNPVPHHCMTAHAWYKIKIIIKFPINFPKFYGIKIIKKIV